METPAYCWTRHWSSTFNFLRQTSVSTNFGCFPHPLLHHVNPWAIFIYVFPHLILKHFLQNNWVQSHIFWFHECPKTNFFSCHYGAEGRTKVKQTRSCILISNGRVGKRKLQIKWEDGSVPASAMDTVLLIWAGGTPTKCSKSWVQNCWMNGCSALRTLTCVKVNRQVDLAGEQSSMHLSRKATLVSE